MKVDTKINKKQVIIFAFVIILLIIGLFVWDYFYNGSPSEKEAARKAKEDADRVNKEYEEFKRKQDEYDKRTNELINSLNL